MDHATAMALARAQQANPETLRIKEHVNAMGVALWCDPGDHAFKGGTSGSQSFTGTKVNDEGREESVQINVCAEHAFNSVLDKDKKEPQALDTRPI